MFRFNLTPCMLDSRPPHVYIFVKLTKLCNLSILETRRGVFNFVAMFYNGEHFNYNYIFLSK